MSSFDRIAGYEKEKAELATLVEIFNNRAKYRLKGASLPKGIIFYGESGTGKTLFSEVLAEECKLNKIIIDLSESASKNNISKQIRRAFTKGAKGKEPTMIFFDEIDKVLPNDDEKYYTDRSKSILTQLLTLIDGMDSSTNVVFVATCNYYNSLPESLIRAGRFDKKIGIGLPDGSSRTAILDMYITASPARFEMSAESISKLSGGFSCAALKTLVNECLLRSDENNFVSEALVREKLTEIKEENITTDRSDASYTIDAVRNVGAFIVSRSYSNSGYVLTTDDDTVSNTYLDALIEDSHYDDDYDEYDDDDYDEDEKSKSASDVSFYSDRDHLAAITALYGGYAAEELMLGKLYNNLSSSFGRIDTMLTQMLQSGMLGATFNYHDYRDIDYPESHLERINEKFIAITEECYAKAKDIVEKNLTLAEKLVNALVKEKSIEKPECEKLIAELGGVNV